MSDEMEFADARRLTFDDIADVFGLDDGERELALELMEERAAAKKAYERDREAFVAEMKKRAAVIAAEIEEELGGDLSVEFHWDAE